MSSFPHRSESGRKGEPTPSAIRYLLLVMFVAALGTLGLSMLNRQFAPEMYSASGPVEIAKALAKGQNYSVFDLNVNIREIRDAHIARMPVAPELAILGASHWQEAHMDLIPEFNAYNAHVHRDYYEDMLGVTEMFVRHGKLPKTMVISLRDNLFTPIADRKDHLWLPGIPYYRAMAKRLGLEEAKLIDTLPVARWREVISVQMLFENVTRWFNAEEHPHETPTRYFKTLDTLLPDGSITWSREHRALFTETRARNLSLAFARANANAPPKIDPKGAEAIDRLISYLRTSGVEVILAQPPFNPIYFDQVRETPYMEGLRRVDALAQHLSEKHGLRIVGSFDPAKVGCDASMYIDAEHSNSACLGRIMSQFVNPGMAPQEPIVVSNAPGMKFDFGAGAAIRQPKKVAAAATGGRAPTKRLVERAADRAPPAIPADVAKVGMGSDANGPLAQALGQAAAKIDDLALQQLAILKNSNAALAQDERAAGTERLAAGAQGEAPADAVTAEAPLAKVDDLALQQLAIIANARAAAAKAVATPDVAIPVATVVASSPVIAIEKRPVARVVRPEPIKQPARNKQAPEKLIRAATTQKVQQPVWTTEIVAERGWPGDPVRTYHIMRRLPAAVATN